MPISSGGLPSASAGFTATSAGSDTSHPQEHLLSRGGEGGHEGESQHTNQHCQGDETFSNDGTVVPSLCGCNGSTLQ